MPSHVYQVSSENPEAPDHWGTVKRNAIHEAKARHRILRDVGVEVTRYGSWSDNATDMDMVIAAANGKLVEWLARYDDHGEVVWHSHAKRRED